MSGPPADQPYTWTDPATGTTYYLQAGRYYDVYGRPYQAPAGAGYGATYPAPTGTAPTWGGDGITTRPDAPAGAAPGGIAPGAWPGSTPATTWSTPVVAPTGGTTVAWPSSAATTAGGGGAPYAPPPPPDPYRDWLSGDAGSRPWRYIGDTDKTFYEDNPTQLYQQYLTDEFGGRQTPLSQYAGNQYGRYYADYLRWSEGDKSGQRTFGDTLSNNLAQQIRNSFSLQSPTQKGYNLMFQPGGRVTGF